MARSDEAESSTKLLKSTEIAWPVLRYCESSRSRVASVLVVEYPKFIIQWDRYLYSITSGRVFWQSEDIVWPLEARPCDIPNVENDDSTFFRSRLHQAPYYGVFVMICIAKTGRSLSQKKRTRRAVALIRRCSHYRVPQ